MEQQRLHGAAGVEPPAAQTGRYHAAVVEHQKVAGLQETADLVEVAMLRLARLTTQHHEAGVVAWLRGCLGDLLPRQVVVKVAGAHGVSSGTAVR